jgi:hypothetical protein
LKDTSPGQARAIRSKLSRVTKRTNPKARLVLI